MAAIRERLDLVDIPQTMRGIPITLIVTALMALAFFGFSGLKLG
jgi:electron transport complex protein RnfA